jgi:hypothetical protein
VIEECDLQVVQHAIFGSANGELSQIARRYHPTAAIASVIGWRPDHRVMRTAAETSRSNDPRGRTNKLLLLEGDTHNDALS